MGTVQNDQRHLERLREGVQEVQEVVRQSLLVVKETRELLERVDQALPQKPRVKSDPFSN